MKLIYAGTVLVLIGLAAAIFLSKYFGAIAAPGVILLLFGLSQSGSTKTERVLRPQRKKAPGATSNPRNPAVAGAAPAAKPAAGAGAAPAAKPAAGANKKAS